MSGMPAHIKTTESNIAAVAKLEEEFLSKRSFVDRIGDAVANFAGSMRFFLLHVVVFLGWTTINAGSIPMIRAFDPYPYILLTMIVSLEGVLLSTFVLMKQNRMSKRAEQRDHLNLQVDLLAEREVTKMLQLQRLICMHLGIKDAEKDPEATEMSQNTAVDTLARELETKMPEQ